jgi:hypothetical protein
MFTVRARHEERVRLLPYGAAVRDRCGKPETSGAVFVAIRHSPGPLANVMILARRR